MPPSTWWHAKRRSSRSRRRLTVRADNLHAKALYERLGFEIEGMQRHAFRVDGVTHDSFAMALLLG